MSASSDARRQRRAAARTGVARVERVIIDGAAVAASVAQGVNLVELVAYHVSIALEALDLAGGDVLAHTVVTIGEHPDYPGDLMIEAKAAKMKTGAGDIAVQPADEADLDDSDDGLLSGP